MLSKKKIIHFIDHHSTTLLMALLLITTVIKYIYLFYLTEFNTYLFSDMGAYWERAIYSFEHDDRAINQWVIWPPFGHIVLGWYFHLLSFLGLYAYKLEIVLGTNILLSTLSVLCIYLIAFKLYPSKLYALMAAAFYALFFPLIYLNTFILSENPSLFLLLFSLMILLYAKHSVSFFLSGLVLAFAIGMRPSFGIIGLPFFLYIVTKDGLSWKNFKHGILFSVAYALLLLLVAMNNHHNSSGKVKTFSANGGVNFYFAQCQKYRVDTYHDGYHYRITPPSTSGKPELGTVVFYKPFYEQSFFYKKGMECMEKSSDTWIDRLQRFKLLYFNSMFPMIQSCFFAKEGIPFFSKVALDMTFLLLFLPLLFYNKRIAKPIVYLLLGIMFSQLIVLYFFNIEQRYLYGFFFVILLLSLLILHDLASHFHKLKR